MSSHGMLKNLKIYQKSEIPLFSSKVEENNGSGNKRRRVSACVGRAGGDKMSGCAVTREVGGGGSRQRPGSRHGKRVRWNGM